MTETFADRMRRLLTQGADAASAYGPEPETGQFRFLMNCSVYQRPFVVVAEQRDGMLRMLENEAPQAGGSGGGGPVAPPRVLGTFTFDTGCPWRGCPHCGSRQNTTHGFGLFWTCSDCPRRTRPGFNCPGQRDGKLRCACGAVTSGPFGKPNATFEIRGTRDVPASSAPRMPPPSAAAARPIPAASGLLRPSPCFTPPPVPTIAAPRPADTPSSLRLRWQK